MTRTGKRRKRSRSSNKKPGQSPSTLQRESKNTLLRFLDDIKTSVEDGQLDRALATLSQAAEYLIKTSNIARPDAVLWKNFGIHLILTGEMEHLLDSLPKMIEILPWDMKIHSHMLFNLHHLPDIESETIFDGHKRWAKTHTPAELMCVSHNNLPTPDRRLRIGYISPNFCTHPVAAFFEPLLDGHDRRKFEVYGYGNVADPDIVNERLKQKFDYYRNIYGLENENLARLIEEDKIDILIELAGHTSNNSLSALAYKPAPVQVSYLGYPGTTGMRQIDYRLTDALANSPQSQKFYTEKLIFLPDGFLCYSPPESAPPVGPLPAEDNGYITFGSFNNNSKINPYIMELWAQILKANENSRLLLKFKQGNDDRVKNHYLRCFERLGISPDRVEICGWKSEMDHLLLYNQVDIALDTYPYNGTTTTCEVLWMGVPVISLGGERHTSRVGLSILSRVGLEFFAAQTAEEYVAKATAMAQNLPSLAKIRATMRQRMAAGDLCNKTGFTENIEHAYREMWHRWCKDHKADIADEKTKSGDRRQLQQDNTKPSKSLEPQEIGRKYKARRGVVYVVWGDTKKAEKWMQRSITSLRQYHPDIPVHVERFDTGSKINKTRLCELTPFEETAYLDNDTVVMGNLDFAFDKARQFGLACCINECPWAKRYSDDRLCGDMVEYNCGILFFTRKAKPVFDAWEKLFPTTDASILHMKKEQLCIMPVANQGSFALAIEQTGFLPFVLPNNWNFRAAWYRSFFGPIKIWHAYHDIPEELPDWNKEQSQENAIMRYSPLDIKKKETSEVC